jgi:hypothetical protein
MEKNNSNGKAGLSAVLLVIALIVIAVMAFFMYQLNNEKNIETKKSQELQAQVDKLNGTVNDLQGKISKVSEAIISNETSNNNDIILDGKYMQGEAGDEVWSFSKDKNVSLTTVISKYKGTYKTIENDMIEVNFTKEERDDIDNPPKTNTYDVNKYYKISIKDDNTIVLVDTNQELHKVKESANQTVSKEEALYVYGSADNSAVNGNPEMLYVYEFSNSVIKFKYHTPWNKEDIEGVAKSTDGETYIYENGNKKVELLLNSMGENSIKVTEYENDSMTSYKNLFK